MKIAIVSAPPDEVFCDKLAWVADGFRAAGHEVRRCHAMRDVRSADAQADLLILDHKDAGVGHHTLADYAPQKKSKWIMWWRDLLAFHADLSLKDQSYIASFGRIMRACDAVLVKERSMLGEYRALGINAHWFDQACPADMPACGHPDKPEYDVLIPGSTYQQRREDARELVAAGFHVAFVGLPCNIGPPIGCESLPWHHPVRRLPQLLSKAAVVLGVDFRTDVDGFTSDRTYLIAGMGGCLVRRESAGMPQIPSWSYADHGSLVDTVRMLVSSVELRRQTGDEARQCVMEHETYKHRAAAIEKIALSSKAENRQCVG